MVINYKEEHCDTFGNLLDDDISKTQMKDIKNMKKIIQSEGLTCGEAAQLEN